MATQQNDIKRILAYSTLSQLGYMVMAMGVAAPEAGMFHLFTHAFFKALLFLGSGAVIYACHHEQDIWKMGGLWKKQPITTATFAIGTLALMGVYGFSGFFSKDSILIAASHHNQAIFILGLISAFLTAYYMTRLFVVVFFGKARTEHAAHAHEVPILMWAPLMLLAIPAWIAGYEKFIHPFLPVHEHGASSVPMIASTAAVLGILIGFFLYRGRDKDPIVIPLLANKFYFDELYAALIRNTQDRLAGVSDFFDRWILDAGIVRLVCSGGTYGLGFVLRLFQVGNIQGYAFLFGAGVIGLLYFVIFK